MAQVFPLKRPEPNKEDLAFLPAALEIVETPPSPLGRAIAFSIMGLFALALAWACIGKVDIIASAKGRIVPSGRTKIIQPFETGVVRAIRVHDGQFVRAGDTLIELDPTMNDAEWKHYQSDLMAAQLDVARLKAELSDGDPVTYFYPPPGVPPELIAVQRQFLVDQIAEQLTKIAVMDGQKEQKQAERRTLQATIDKLEALLKILQERVEIRKTLFEHATGSKAEYLKLLQEFVEEQHNLEVGRRKLDEIQAAIATIERQRMQAVEEFRRARYGELVEAERKASGLEKDLVRALHRSQLQVLTSPVDGTVQQLAVHTIGGVVTPAQSLMVVVPSDSHLEIEAMIENRDIGFVHPGQEAQIKVDAFNFNRYGLIDGRVASISTDAILHDRFAQNRKGDKGANADSDSSEPPGQELVYGARVALDKSQMQIDGKMVGLSPGMAVTVQIKTGSRRIISYLLSPLLKMKQEALRER